MPGCELCAGTGLVNVDECTCGGGDFGHESHCGLEMCPAGCWAQITSAGPPAGVRGEDEPALAERLGITETDLREAGI